MENIEELKERIEQLEKANTYLESQKTKYENGDAKLYYALQRKMTEMANLLNKNNLEDCELDDPKSKSFDRLAAMLQKCETISASASALGVVAGVTGNEKVDTTKTIFVNTIADSRK
jgi:DNA repair exonuclease SbcCD ATPase subunit